jgi:hypothetical protein
MVAKNEVPRKSFGDLITCYLGTKSYLKYIIIFCATLTVGVFLIKKTNFTEDSTFVEVDWRLLGNLDYITGKATLELEALDGKSIKVPGFMVPLEDRSKSVTDFLLVPSPQACIHIPPPPPNQMVYVKMENHSTEAAFGPIWVYGTFHLKSQRHKYGESSFSLTGTKTEPYQQR